ncbi:MAG: protein-glutamate O-methyltransferase CheR [Planctomycetales bacterium]|nr:protein-glutamate O-methyltransferase CheR [Planctomycetales bacterium]
MAESTLTTDAMDFVCTLVRNRSAIELESNKGYLVEARLGPVAKLNGFGSTLDLLRSLRAKPQPQLEHAIVEAMTTNETSFFRDTHPFDALSRSVLPARIEARKVSRTLNIWSAACSSGQELYSIAMIIREQFPELLGWKLELLGTDLSETVFERARQGIYSQIEVNRGLSAGRLVKFFERSGAQWKLKKEVTDMATFRKMNLIECWPTMPQMDVVFLRNVLIYFSTDTKRMILSRVRKIMAPGGILFLGAAETTLNLDTSFERVTDGDCVYYRVG